MSKDMLGAVVRAAVGVPQDRLNVLAKIASAMAADNPVGEACHERLGKLLEEGFASLVSEIGKVNIAGVSSFVAAKKFRLGETIDGIKVGWLGGNFKKHFLPKIESKEVMAEELVVNNLLRSSKDPAIITVLGGEEKVETSLGQFWEFLKTSNQKFWYIAYVRDVEDALWAVGARWGGDGLYVGASSLDDPIEWNADARFLSR